MTALVDERESDRIELSVDGESATELEQLRRAMGLSRIAMVRAVESGETDEAKIELAKGLLGRYLEWKTRVLDGLKFGGSSGKDGEFSTREIARALDISEFYVFQLRWRGFLPYTRKVGRTYRYTAKDVEKLFELSESRVGSDEKGDWKRGPLGHAFLRVIGLDSGTEGG